MTRTVSMLPAATEIVGALGLLDHLVAVSHECDFPSGVEVKPRATHCEIHNKGLPSAEVDRWVADRLRAGESLYTLDEPLLRSLSPSIVLTQKLCDVCAPSYGSVEAFAATMPSPPRLLNLEPSSLAGIFDNIRAVATALGHPERGDDVVAGLERRVARVVERVAGLPRPSVFVMEWTEPIFNAGHWTPELVQLAGGTPVLSKVGTDSKRIAWEDLRAENPEFVLLACCGLDIERTQQDVPALERLPGWKESRAVAERHVYVVNGSAYFSRPGPRLVDSLEILASILHPETCADFNQGRAVAVYS
jgi:iron complex transport system substrate-binding protein